MSILNPIFEIVTKTVDSSFTLIVVFLFLLVGWGLIEGLKSFLKKILK